MRTRTASFRLAAFGALLSPIAALAASAVLQVEFASPTSVQLTWSNPPPNSILESVDEFSDCLLWQAVPATPVFSNGRFSVTLPVSGASRLFHLYPLPAQNLPPVWCPLPDQSVTEASTLEIPLHALSPNRRPVTFGAVTPLVNATLDGVGGVFRFTPVTSQLGTNLLTFFATDGTLTSTQQVRVTVLPLAIFEQLAADGSTTLSWSSAVPGFELLQSDTLGPNAVWTTVSGTPLLVGAKFQITLPPSASEHYYRLKLVPLPADPATLASPLVPNTFNDLGSATAFLYTGPGAIQSGVPPGAIVPTRAAVVRGRVTRRDQSPLPAVRVTVLNHPEYGYTLTRADGMFDLAVNGGLYTLEFEANGYCGAQRQVEAPFQDFRTVPDLALVPLDPVATPVIFGSNAPPQMAAGSRQTDADGTRTTRVFLPAGTTATVTTPDGTPQPVNRLTLHVTEYTVGANGPAAMPAVLPPTSAYTFCAEFNAEEELASGAEIIQFNQPVFGYVENFLKVPVGMLVPSGYYDPGQAVWVPSDNGIVLEILGVANGLAQVDVTGSNVVADAATLASMGFTIAELQQLAATYSPGQSIWRVPLSHFGQLKPWDWNWAVAGPSNGTGGNGPGGNAPNGNPSPGGGGPKPQSNPNDNSQNNFGNVNFTTQVFQEAVPLVGVPMTLHYSSARVPDYLANAQVVIQALSWPPSTNILGLEVQFEVAGRSIDEQLGVVPTVTFSWDGYDAYGRFVGGSHMASGRIILETPFDYSGSFASTAQGLIRKQPLFAGFGQTAFAAGHSATAFGIPVPFSRLLTVPDHRALGLGGWSLTPQHSYDPVGGLLYLGDGTVLRQDRLANGIKAVPGLSAVPHYTAALNLAAGPDGTLFLLANFDDSPYVPRLCKLDPAGQFSYLSGNSLDSNVVSVDSAGYGPVDGKPALLAAFGSIKAMTVGPDGSLYFRNDYTIGRIDPLGILHKVLGDGPTPRVYPPDGTPAGQAMTQPTTSTGCLAVGPDGTVYYDDFGNAGCPPGNYTCGTNSIRKVAPDGLIYTVAGQGGSLWTDSWADPTNGWRGQIGRPASAARLTAIAALAAAPDGTLYISPSVTGPYAVGGIYRIARDGTLGMAMNAVPLPSVGFEGVGGDDGTNAASFASYYGNLAGPNNLSAAADGSLIFAQTYAGFPSLSVIWRITPDGFLQRLAGRGSGTTVSTPYPSPQIGVNPLQVLFKAIAVNIAVGPDGSLTLVGSDHTPWRFGAAAASFSGQELEIPAQDASEIYVFDAHGLHLRTLDGLTGSTNWSFSYDANNLVTGIRDASGLLTHVERDSAGRPTGIVGPYGQRTTLGLDVNGFLNAVVNPVGEVTGATYSKGGLLTSVTGPLNDSYTVAYDSVGRVTRVRDPLGGGYDISSTNSGTQVAVTASTTLANVEGRVLTLSPSGDTVVTVTRADGTGETTTLAQSGALSFTNTDRTVSSYSSGGDPRFPTATRLLTQSSVSWGGVTATATFSRSAALADQNNPFSVVAMTNGTTLNGNTWISSYTGSNRVWRTTSPEGRQTLIGLDALGRLLHGQTPGRSPVDVLYDGQGRLSELDDTASAGVRRTTFSYDSLGRLSELTDALGRTNQVTYDGAGRVRQLTLANGETASFQSDAEGHLTSVTPPGRPAHQFAYNAVGLATNYLPPVVNGLDESVHYAYDADRSLTNVTLPDGQSIRLTRGSGGRLERLVLGSGPTLTYAYASAGGLLTNIVSSTGDSLRFDYQGTLVSNTIWSGAVTGRVSHTFNANFLATTQSVNGAAIAYGYDRDLLLTNAGSLTLSRDHATGFITGTSLGSVTDQRQFDDRGLLTNYVAKVSGTATLAVAMSYDLLGRLTNKVETIAGTTRTFGYVYDVAGRLQQVWRNGVLATTYTYDGAGNRLNRNGETATYDVQDRLTTYNSATYAWSPNGTLSTSTRGGNTTTYTYDLRGVLTSVALPDGRQINYLIDPQGYRVGKKINGVLQRGWLWSGPVPVTELGSNSQVTARFVFGSRPNVPDYVIKGTNAFRLLCDERGSVRMVINVADGTVAQQLDYDEFGRVLADTAPGFQPFGFAGGLYDPDTGLVRFVVRDYDPETGRWTARDPLGFLAGQLSLYTYLGGDPINYIDPLGLGPSKPNAWYQGAAGLLSIAGGIGLIAAAATVVAVGTPAAAVAATVMALQGSVGLVGGLVNTTFAAVAPGTTVPTGLGGVAASAAGNSAQAQRWGAAADLGFGLGASIGTRAATAALGGAATAASATENAATAASAAENANNAVTVADAIDKGANAYGLAPGSAPLTIPAPPPGNLGGH